MTIFIDADSFPALARQKAIELASQYHVEIVCVANHPLNLLHGVAFVRVDRGKDRADRYILSTMVRGDIVLTQDILLAKEALNSQCHALNGYGVVFTDEIVERYLVERKISMALATADRSYRSTAKNYDAEQAIVFKNGLRHLIQVLLRGRV